MVNFFRDKFIHRKAQTEPKVDLPFAPVTVEEPEEIPDPEFSFLPTGSEADFPEDESKPSELPKETEVLYYDYWNPETNYSEPMEGQMAMGGFPEMDFGEQLQMAGFEETSELPVSLEKPESETIVKPECKLESAPQKKTEGDAVSEADLNPFPDELEEAQIFSVEDIDPESELPELSSESDASSDFPVLPSGEDIEFETSALANSENVPFAVPVSEEAEESPPWISLPRGARQWKSAIFVALFFLLCLVPLIGLCITGPAPAAANEIAAAAPKLKKVNGEFNTDYLSDLANYVSKGFWGRLQCITAWDQFCAKVFHSSQCDEVLLGKDGWLFYYTEADEAAGADRMTEREAWCAARAVYLMQNYCETNGVRFVFASPNGKAALYPEKIRDYVQLSEGRDLDIVQSYLTDMGVNFCDMYELFASRNTVLYWHTDSHWNGKGAALAADSLLNALGYDSVYYTSGFTLADPHTGDLYEMLYPSGTLTELDYEPLSGWSFAYTSNFRTVNDILISTESASGDGSLLMYRDSFGRNLYPYLAESFSTADFSRLNNYTLYTLEDGSYTDVIVEIGSKNLRYLVDYPAYYPAVERDFGNLTGYIKTDCGVTVEDGNGDVPGCVKVTGTFGAKAEVAVDSPVMLLADGRLYEAIPTADGFVAYLETGEAPTEFAVYTLAVNE